MTDSQKGSIEVKAAISDIRKVNKKDITELKAFAHPPQYVKIVMDAVCVMFGISPSWKNAKRLLGDAHFITRIQSYDVDNISPEIMTKISMIITSLKIALERKPYQRQPCIVGFLAWKNMTNRNIRKSSFEERN